MSRRESEVSRPAWASAAELVIDPHLEADCDGLAIEYCGRVPSFRHGFHRRQRQHRGAADELDLGDVALLVE